MFTTLIRRIFRTAGASAPADHDILVDRRGNVPVYLGGVQEAVMRLRPVIVRDQHRQRSHPAEQGPVGTRADQDFAPPPAPAPMIQPKWRPLDAGPLRAQPYAVDPETFGASQAEVDRAAAKAMFVRWPPYSLTGRDLSG